VTALGCLGAWALLSVAQARGDKFEFTFDQIDVTAFVKVVGQRTGKKLAVSDDVKGRITVVAPAVDSEQVWPLFVSILETAGCSVVQDGDVYRVITLPKRIVPIAKVVGDEEPTPSEGMVTKVIRLEHVRASEVKKALQGQVDHGKGGPIGAVDDTNHLIVTDTASAVRRVERLVQEIDQPGLSRVTEVVGLEFAGAEELAHELTEAMSETQTRGDLLRNRLPNVAGARDAARRIPTIVASPHANRLVLVGTQSQLADLKELIAQMDVDSPTGRGRLNAVFLKYLSAEEAAKSLSALLEVPVDKRDQAGPRKRRIAIQASAANNAILVDASPGDFDTVKRLIEQLDQLPQQVHIEVMIAEKSASEVYRLGVEMAAIEMPGQVGSTTLQGGSTLTESAADNLMNVIQSGVFPSGISVGLAHGSYINNDGEVVPSYPAMLNINAMKKRGDFKLLSRTSLEAQDNKEATVSIVNEYPILKSTVEGSGDSRDIVQNIERLDVGIQLTLKPHVVPGGDVQMDLNPSIEAVIDPGPTGTQFAPTIAKREVTTTVTVPDGRTIIIAGLTREDQTETVKRVPLLGSIPIIGFLFRDTVEQTEKTDLLIFVTPTVVQDAEGSARIRDEWEQKTGLPNDEGE